MKSLKNVIANLVSQLSYDVSSSHRDLPFMTKDGLIGKDLKILRIRNAWTKYGVRRVYETSSFKFFGSEVLDNEPESSVLNQTRHIKNGTSKDGKNYYAWQ